MAIALVASVSKLGTGNSAGVNTTGATLLVTLVSSATVTVGSRTDLDSLTNTWTLIGAIRTGGPFGQQCALYYVNGSPSVGSGHTFNDTAETTPYIGMLAFSGTATSSALDQVTGAAAQTSPAHAGSLTPSANNAVVVFGGGGYATTQSMDGGFTLQEHGDGAAGVNYSGALGYLIQTTAAAANPGLTSSPNVGDATGVTLASFLAAGGGGSTNWGPWIAGNNWNRLVQNVR